MIRSHLGRKINFNLENYRMCCVLSLDTFISMKFFLLNVQVLQFFHSQPSIRHIFPSVFSWHECFDLYSVRLVQWFIYNEFCCGNFTVIRRFLDSKEHHGPLIGRFAMVELHRWQRPISLGLWIEKGTAKNQLSLLLFHKALLIITVFVFLLFFACVAFFLFCAALPTNLYHFIKSCILLIMTFCLFIALQCSMLCFCVEIFNLAGSC